MTVAIDRIAITKGRITVEAPGGRGKSRAYDDLQVDVRDVSSTTKFPFKMTLRAPGGGTIDVDGSAGPLSAAGVGATPLDASVTVKRLDLASTGVVDSAAGIGGIVDLALRVVSDGRRVASTGTLHADKLQLMPGGAPASVPL